MITTDFVPGSPCWLDLGAPDVGAAAGFYRSVFGWEYRPVGPEAGGYGVFRLDGEAVAGLGPLDEEGARPAWTVYFRVPDADAATRTVRESGGTVRVPPTEVGGEGRMAQCTDPQGGRFAVWEPGSTKGLEAVDGPGSLSWTELCTTDTDGAKEFYGNLFGWRTQDVDLPGDGGTYTLITPAGLPEERMHGGMIRLPAEQLRPAGGGPYWHPVFGTADCDATAAGVAAGGGTVRMGPEDAEGIGRLAVCADPAGAEFVVLAPARG